MLALLQRVKQARVDVEAEVVGQISQGLLVFLAIEPGDTRAIADRLLQRILGYRIFSDSCDKMNLSVRDIAGELLIVSQFTLAANTNKGTRPSFSSAATPELGEELFNYFVMSARELYGNEKIATGKFAANMQVSLCNDGPVTFLLR